MRNAILINIGLAAGSVFGCLLLIEFGLRVTGLQTIAPNPPKIYEASANPDISYKLKPNLQNQKAYKASVSTDANGFRLNGTQSPITDYQSPLIAVLGDSIAFGYGINDNETLAAQLEMVHSSLRNFQFSPKGLPSVAIFNFQFINAAVPGYQLQQEIALYKEKVAPLAPDGVIVVFFWNDLDGFLPGMLDAEGILRPNGWEPTDDHCQPITEGMMGLIPGKCWLDTHSAVYKVMKKLIDLKQSKLGQIKEREEARQQEADPATPEKLAAYEKDLQHVARELPPKRWLVIWPDNFLHVQARAELRRMGEQQGFQVIDLYEKFGNQVETLSWDTVHPSAESIKKAAEFIKGRLGEIEN